MKESTKNRLMDELRSGQYCYNASARNPKYLDQLFEIYLEEEIDSASQFINTFNVSSCRDLEFYKFVLDNIDAFKINSLVLRQHASNSAEELLAYDAAFAINRHTRHLQKYDIKNRQKFVDITDAVVGDGRLLDVGSGGELPLSSLLFARDRGKITSMDNFCLYWRSLGFLKKIGVDAKSEYLTDETDLSAYDVIVGQRPCSAINPIVTKCANSDEKEYFIEMCDCASPKGGMEGFVNYLKEKDERLKSIMLKKIDRNTFIYGVNNVSGATSTHTVYITNSEKHPDDILEIVAENNGCLGK